ncbi:hypothetical protein DQ384_15925 [Sphaerisporangium album]|uniref:Uncharacterized protein n=1 Tax=Sphaerisporangium album TaxID=509200 RepID=A0A367FIU7_9ACTN|nr:hypothetical protein [Sphaerisporangium album]RCG30234.1 hypothetical protein DQ384_15925 [Sphaerisporangium album]
MKEIGPVRPIYPPAHPKTSPEELVKAKKAGPIKSLADLAAPHVFETDEELAEFLAFTYAERHADLNFPSALYSP